MLLPEKKPSTLSILQCFKSQSSKSQVVDNLLVILSEFKTTGNSINTFGATAEKNYTSSLKYEKLGHTSCVSGDAGKDEVTC